MQTATNIKASGMMAANMAKATCYMLMAAIMLAFGSLTREFNDSKSWAKGEIYL